MLFKGPVLAETEVQYFKPPNLDLTKSFDRSEGVGGAVVAGNGPRPYSGTHAAGSLARWPARAGPSAQRFTFSWFMPCVVFP